MSAATQEHALAVTDGWQVVLEGDALNLVVTSPAATLALALMFLKTNDTAVAGYFFIPDSAYALDLVRPDQVRGERDGRSHSR